MSNSDHDEVGYGKPPRKHQFSKENQPLRRKSKAPKAMGHDVLANILHAMGEDVPVTLDGKPSKAKLGYVFARQLVKRSVSGTLNEQIKFAHLLRSYGELDPDIIRKEAQEALEKEFKEALEEEQSRYTELLGYFVETVDLLKACRLAFKDISDGFLGARSTCSCGSFDDYPEAAQAIVEWYQDDDPEDPDNQADKCPGVPNSGWAPSRYGSDPTADHDDDLSAGMIGND